MTFPQMQRREFSVDGRMVRLRPSEHAVLTGLLFNHPDRPMSREELIDWVWPEDDSRRSTNLTPVEEGQPIFAKAQVAKHVHFLRVAGINVQTMWGRGYHIAREDRG